MSECLAGGLWMAECWWHFLEGCSLPSGCHSLRWTTRYRKSHFHCPCPKLCHASFLHGLVWGKRFAGGALIKSRREKVLSKHCFTHQTDQIPFRKTWFRVSAGKSWSHFLVGNKNYTQLVNKLKVWSSKFSLLKMFTARITSLLASESR